MARVARTTPLKCDSQIRKGRSQSLGKMTYFPLNETRQSQSGWSEFQWIVGMPPIRPAGTPSVFTAWGFPLWPNSGSQDFAHQVLLLQFWLFLFNSLQKSPGSGFPHPNFDKVIRSYVIKVREACYLRQRRKYLRLDNPHPHCHSTQSPHSPNKLERKGLKYLKLIPKSYIKLVQLLVLKNLN